MSSVGSKTWLIVEGKKVAAVIGEDGLPRPETPTPTPTPTPKTAKKEK